MSNVTDISASDDVLPDDDVVYQITTFGADYTVDGLIDRFERGDIFRPNFQRNYVWTLPQASKFIESILLGLPIPSVFLYREESTQRHLIVDGLQRLTTLHAYYTGLFPGNGKIFRLRDVKPRYEGKSLQDLAPEDQRRFRDAIVHAMVIQQTAPTDNVSSVFHIFERLNSNGTPLQPQEMRAAIYHGTFEELLDKVNENIYWRRIFGPVHKRSKDEELILRFLALFNNSKNYEKPMKLFLNKFMGKYRNVDEKYKQEFENIFISTIEKVFNSIGDKAFRITRSLNAAVFDSVMVGIASNPEASENHIRKAYRQLMSNKRYNELVSQSTADEANVAERVKIAVEVFGATSEG